MKVYQYRVCPVGRHWSKVLVFDGPQPVKSYLVAAPYYGGNIPEFIEKNKHIEQFVIQYHEIAEEMMLNVNDVNDVK